MKEGIPMVAGRELDALVAEKVMGFKLWRSPVQSRFGKPDCWVNTKRRGSPSITIEGFQPSREMGYMMWVVERLEKAGWWLKLTRCHYYTPDGEGDGWAVEFRLIESYRPRVEVGYGATPCLAICLAALQAVGVGGGSEERA